MRQFQSIKSAIAQILSLSLSTALLSASGVSFSGASNREPATTAREPSTTTEHISMTVRALPETAHPTFHLAPVILSEPEDTDRREPAASVRLSPHRAAVRPEFALLSTRRLTAQIMQQVLDTGTVPESALADGSPTKPFASSSAVTVYTPAQIRAAYGLPALPTTSSVTSAQAAQMGAGQTIYLIDAYGDANVLTELATFNAKFGLPGCVVTPILPAASLPLAAAPTVGCTISIVYTNSNGAMVTTVPAYNSSWATETAMDVQWAHATAPYARIVLIATADGSTTSLANGVAVANAMGPGVVSQSFGAAEAPWTVTFEPTYSAPNMTYVASTGDSGEAVNWPAVDPHVLAVSGTSLTYSGTGARSETVWSDSGGGVSAYVATPSYQTLGVPGMTVAKNRAVSDVSFNADPYTGQYLAILAPGASSVTWYSGGGTSISAPQWAAILAIANAERAQSSLQPVGQSQPILYNLATQATSYAGSFLDIKSGSDGTCAACYANIGYDPPSGLGSPNVATLLPSLVGHAAASAPVVASASVTGKPGVALTFALSATDANPLTYSISGAPSGMTVNATTGVVSWPAPLAGSYSIGAVALDALTGLSGQATISLVVVATPPPAVAGGTVSGVAGTPLLFSAQATDINSVTYSLSGAPSGMTVSTSGVVSWTNPLHGTYAVTVTAKDATTGLSGHGLYTLTISAAVAPVVHVNPTGYTAQAGKSASFLVAVTDANPVNWSLSGAPAGMSFIGPALFSWSNPVVGTYTVTIIATDPATGLSGKATTTLTVPPAGPVVAATSLTGVAGEAFKGSVTITDASSTSVSVTVSGVPSGMNISSSTGVLTFAWAAPVTGSYTLHLTVTDSKNLTGSGSIPLVITAH
jgi:subtilase family serine protease